MKRFKNFYKDYGYLWIAPVYLIFYLIWFVYLEIREVPSYHMIHMAIDDYIPFCEYFVIPYFLWFLFVPVSVVLMVLAGKKDFYRIFSFLSIGMTLFLIISTIYPNGAQLRPEVFPRNNIFTSWVKILYDTDAAANLFPSIHVYDSLGAMFAILECRKYSERKVLRSASVIICLLIILSTMFIKQHSVFDVITGLIMGIVMYAIIYRCDIALFSFSPVS